MIPGMFSGGGGTNPLSFLSGMGGLSLGYGPGGFRGGANIGPLSFGVGSGGQARGNFQRPRQQFRPQQSMGGQTKVKSAEEQLAETFKILDMLNMMGRYT